MRLLPVYGRRLWVKGAKPRGLRPEKAHVNVERLARSTVILLLLTGLAARAQELLHRPVGFALGDGAYLVETDPIRGDAALLDGEAISTNVAPARIYHDNGAFAILGPGSQARIFEDRIVVSGVSLEMLRFGDPAAPVEAGAVSILPATQDARVSVFTDRPSVVSVMVSKGSVDVTTVGGRVLRRMPAGSSATFAQGQGEIRIQEKRAALEIARICMRQLEMLAVLEGAMPGVKDRREVIVKMLSDASGGLLAPTERGQDLVESPEIPTGLPAVSPERLIVAAREAHFRLNQEGLDEAGCGDPECAAAEPPRWRNRFFGWAGGFYLPPPGCVLCQPGVRIEESDPQPMPELAAEP